MKSLLKKNIWLVVVFLFVLLIGLFFIFKRNDDFDESIDDVLYVEKQEEIVVEDEKLRVDIKGEVNNPGVYQLNVGDRVSDVIKASGGLTENADTSLINLSKSLKDEMVIIVYNKYDVEELRNKSDSKTVIQYIEKECSCPDSINDACVGDFSDGKSDELSKNNKISLNNASQSELESLPGIGEAKAKSIIKYREENNGFNSIDEVMNISGIGESIFEKFKDYIAI